MNLFESGERKNIPAVLVYIRRGDQFLMIHRNAQGREVSKKVDYHAGKWNGLGGKCEPDESALETAQREVAEEAGLELSPSQFKPLGVIQFPNFKPARAEDWTVFVFTVRLGIKDRREPSAKCAEGDLHWIPAKDIRALNLWPGDHYFLPMVIEERPFTGAIWYQDGHPKRHAFQLFGPGHGSGI